MLRGVDEFVWTQVFEFQESDDRAESVVWRAVVPEDAAVHALGCAKQAGDRAKGKTSVYRGFINSTAGTIRRSSTTRGHGFLVVHVPAEGDWHAHVQVALADGIPKLSKGDKSDIRALMEQAFGQLHPHACP